MEYIEPKPKEIKPHAKRNRIIILSSVASTLVVALTLGYYFLIKDVFLDYDNVGIFTYSYRTDVENSGVTITAIDDNAVLPAKFRIPNKLSGRPVVEIADGVFQMQGNVEEITLPDTIQIIGNNCFEGCEKLAKFNVPHDLNSVGNDAFKDTKWLLDSDVGEVAIGSIIYEFKGEMKYDSAIVKSLDLSPNTFTGDVVDLSKYKNAADGAFKDQPNLVYASFPDYFDSVSASLFQNCTSLETVVFPENLKTIESNAFYGCSSLSDVSLIPNSVETIGDYAFAYSKLSGELSLKNSLTSIGVGAFMNCAQITKVIIPDEFQAIPDYLFQNCTLLSDVEFQPSEYTSASKINYIGENAFQGTAISEFHLPFNATSIKKSAFASCPNLERIYALNNIDGVKQNIYVPNADTGVYEWEESSSTYQGLLTIGASAFNASSKFVGLVLVDKTNNAISSLDEFTCPITLSSLGGTNNDAFLLQGSAVTTLNLGKDTSSVDPNNTDFLTYLSEHKVETLPPSLCEGAEHLTAINFGGDNSTVTRINRAAFKSCIALEGVVINNSVTTLETNVFEACSALKSVILPNKCDSITTRTFYGCTALLTINIPGSYKTIGQEAFANCTSLASITFDAFNVTNIGANAFSGDSALTSFAMGNSCDALATGIFSNCTSLGNVTLSTSSRITSVKESMFEGDTSLSSINLPSNYKAIDAAAFKGCTALKEITLNSTKVVTANATSFDGVTLAKINVPSSLVDSYKADTYWSAYASIIQAIA